MQNHSNCPSPSLNTVLNPSYGDSNVRPRITLSVRDKPFQITFLPDTVQPRRKPQKLTGNKAEIKFLASRPPVPGPGLKGAIKLAWEFISPQSKRQLWVFCCPQLLIKLINSLGVGKEGTKPTPNGPEFYDRQQSTRTTVTVVTRSVRYELITVPDPGRHAAIATPFRS